MAEAIRHVSFILGGAAYVSREAWDRGDLGLRALTKRGKPRNRRGSDMPLMVSRCLTIDAIGERRA